VLELNQPKPLGGNNSQVSLHVLIQLKIPQNLRFKEITKGKRRGTPEEEEQQNHKHKNENMILEARRTPRG
jgi:hypothetical protein